MYTIENEPAIVREVREKILTTFADLEFYEEGHIYLLHGKQLKSASGVGERFISRPFDKDAQAKAYAQKHGETPEYWLQQWEQNNLRATTQGTKIHEFGESLSYVLNGHPEMICESARELYDADTGLLSPASPKEEAVVKFFQELPPSYHLVLNEAKAYSGLNPDATKNLKEQLCGTFDMLYYFDGEGDPERAGFMIFDYKTNRSLLSDYNRRYGIGLLEPFQDFVQEDYGLYTIQLSLYALMLEDIGIPIIDRRLIWLTESGYHVYQVPNVIDRLRRVL